MSFREKTAWISIVAMVAIYGAYFWALKTGHHTGLALGGLLETVIALVVTQVVLITAAAIFAPRDALAPRDERERMIDLKATKQAYAALATALTLAVFFGAFTPPIVFDANALLFVLVWCEIMRNAFQVVQYRRGA
jgi:hypothetical protein